MADLTVVLLPPTSSEEVGLQKPSFDVEVGMLI